MKLVGGDSGRVEHEQFVEDVILAPSERVVVDVLFETPGELTLEHRTPDRTYKLADITVSEEQATPSLARGVRDAADRAGAHRGARAADVAGRRCARQDAGVPGGDGHGRARHRRGRHLHVPMHPKSSARIPALSDVRMKLSPKRRRRARCPMHPEVTSETADHCPQCGMKLVPARLVQRRPAAATTTRRHEHGHSHEAAGASSGKTTWST
jgi:hypothetical protein